MSIIEPGNKRLGDFIKHIIYNPFPIDGQRCLGSREYLFFEDLVTIEIAKYFYIGEESYLNDPAPRRLVCTPSFSKEAIVSECRELEEKLISEKHNMDLCDCLSVLHCGRGLSLLLLLKCSDWKQIYVEDEDPRYYSFLSFFPELTTIGEESDGRKYVFKTKPICE